MSPPRPKPRKRAKNVMAKHYSIGQLRVDLWNALREATAKLCRAEPDSEGLELVQAKVDQLLERLGRIEKYFAHPGSPSIDRLKHEQGHADPDWLANSVAKLVKDLVSDSYRGHPQGLKDYEDAASQEVDDFAIAERAPNTIYFEVLIVEDLSPAEEEALRESFRAMQQDDEEFCYNLVVAHSFQDALIAALFNFNIHAVVIRYAPEYQSTNINEELRPFLQNVMNIDHSDVEAADLGPLLAREIRKFRPELDLYYVTDTALTHVKDRTLATFRRIFYRREDVQELHLAILVGIRKRYRTPFFSALKEYSQQPTGVFHAMPISRGNSVFKSRWIKDFGDFYGRNMFLAETSATTGGLDSLLQPTGSLKHAQELAASTYGARNTFFVTNGTSTANKIVVQALVEPGDLVLIDRDCHKSHHYGMVLSGALPVYLDSYPVEAYSMYGAVPLREIKDKLLYLKAQGRLDKVRMLLLTNCTFDGLVYNVERVMEEILAIKPDMIFLWDEAWFAFAGFTYTYKQRTGMYVARKLHSKYQRKSYRKEYQEHLASLAEGESPRLPDPDKVRIRVYVTQSTHKTLSSFRQGSMIHVWDEDFGRLAADTFHEAYMTHTSTSPNYQMLASLDVGRRQVVFEGYEMVEKSIELAMMLRAKIDSHPRLRKYFSVLTIGDLIPSEFRSSNLSEYYQRDQGWNRMEDAWEHDEFVLDPTKITLSVGKAGIDGDTFKNVYLMDKYKIQINKTSRNTVLLMTNIGTTRSSVLFLISVMLKIADQLDEDLHALTDREIAIRAARVESLVNDVPPLPDFSHFHSSFQAVPGVSGGDIRGAYFLAYNDTNCDFVPLEQCLEAMQERELVSASFVIPYPPGFPVLVPGQVLSRDILEFLLALDVKEIHGYRPALGLRVFTDAVLNRQRTFSAMGERPSAASLPPHSPQAPSSADE